MAAGAITGFAASVVMMTLGAALGLTATAAAVPSATDYAADSNDMGQAAVGFGIGAGVWLLLSAAVVGIVGGSVLARMSNAGRAYSPGAHGFLTWALGVAIAVVLAASSSGAVAGVLGVGAGGAAAGVSRVSMADGRESDVAATPASLERRANASRPAASADDPVTTADEREAMRRAAEVAAASAATAAWFALIAMLIGLGATIGAAKQRKFQQGTGLGHGLRA